MSWSQPCCKPCWDLMHPGHWPVMLMRDARTVQRCAWCGRETSSGIFVRADPTTVPYPREDDE